MSTRISPRKLADAILEAITLAPLTTAQLSIQFNYSKDAVLERTMYLESLDKAHWVYVPGPTGRGRQKLWKSGPGPVRPARTTPTGPLAHRFGAPFQVTTCEYPIVGRRDPLVAIFFSSPASGMPSPIVDSAPVDSVDLAGRHFDQVNQVNQVGER